MWTGGGDKHLQASVLNITRDKSKNLIQRAKTENNSSSSKGFCFLPFTLITPFSSLSMICGCFSFVFLLMSFLYQPKPFLINIPNNGFIRHRDSPSPIPSVKLKFKSKDIKHFLLARSPSSMPEYWEIWIKWRKKKSYSPTSDPIIAVNSCAAMKVWRLELCNWKAVNF